jgi:hypothetical protein
MSRHSGFLQGHDNSDGEMEFPSGGISPQSKDLLAPLTVTRTEVRERIVVPELFQEDFLFSTPDEPVRAAERAPIPGPIESAISLKAHVDKVAATCPLCGQRKVQGDREEGENTEGINSLSCSVIFSDHPDPIFRTSFSIQLLFI